MHSTYVRMQLDRQRSRRGQTVQKHVKKTVKKRMRNCCRHLTAFLCSQVGICSLLVGYSVVGAFGFMILEEGVARDIAIKVEGSRDASVSLLWNITSHLNVLDKERWKDDVFLILGRFQESVVKAARKGYAGKMVDARWSFPQALMFCLATFTTIGYGNLVPQTVAGKAATMVYATFGIPLMLLYMSNVGEVLAASFKYTYSKLCICKPRQLPSSKTGGQPKVEVLELEVADTVSVNACLAVILSFVLGGGILFAAWEDWDFVDGAYFCFISLLTIGFGDLVPGALTTTGDLDSKLVITALYLVIGMAILAMAFNLLQEKVVMRIERFARSVGLLRQKE